MSIPVIKEPILYVDVDDTLVSWFQGGKGPYDTLVLKSACETDKVELKIHWETVEQIKLHKLRGHSVVVWSAGGAEWANKVVTELGIERLVDAVLAKPSFFLDDQPATNFMQEHKRRDVRMKDE